VQMGELEFRSSAGGAALTGTWTATTDAGTGFELANIHDGNLSTTYASVGGFVPVNTVVVLDLGLGNDTVVLQVAIAPRPGQEQYAPAAFTVDASDDGATWTTIADFAGIVIGDYADNAFTLFAVPGPGVYDSRMSEYLVEGPFPGVYDSRMSEYLLEGSNNSLFVSRTSQYIILGPGGNPSQLMLGTF